MAEAKIDGKYGYTGDYTINYLDLRSFGFADYVDITGMFASIEITESIYSPFMTIKVTLIDGNGLMDITAMTGEEVIVADIRAVDQVVGFKNHTFFVYKIADRGYISDRGVVYDIYGVSIEALNDINTKISKSYTGQPSEIAKSIMTDYIKSDKSFFVEDTKNKVQYISNYWNPIKNMKFLCDRSISRETNSPAYMFFETQKSFLFTSLGRLVSQPSTMDYYYSNNLKMRGDEVDKLKIVENFYVDEAYDYMKRVSSGALGSRTLLIDPMDKSYKYTYHDFYDSFAKNARLNNRLMISKESPRSVHTHFQQRITPNAAYANMPNDNSSSWFAEKSTQYASIELQTAQIDVPGNFGILAGNVIDFYIYANRNIGQSDNLFDALDRNFSGRYLVTSVKHIFDKERHSMSLQINKDSLFVADKETTK